MGSIVVCLLSVTPYAEDSSKISEGGAYRYELEPESGRFPIGELHRWVLTLAMRAGEPFVPQQIQVSGGMPEHGHGLPAAAEVTRHLGGGRFVIDGVLFNMPGEWLLRVSFTGPAGSDVVSHRFTVDPPARQRSAADGESLAERLGFTGAEVVLTQSLSLAALGEPVESAGNGLVGNTLAIALGAQLFEEPGLSGTGKVSCATCHRPDRYFADTERFSRGSSFTKRHAPSVQGAAYRRWLYWDGRRDSLWSQALTPLETPGEMDNARTDVVRFVANHADYGRTFAELLGADEEFDDPARFPVGAGPFAGSAGKSAWAKMAPADKKRVNDAFVIVGKIIAAYEWTVMPGESRFDRFAGALDTDAPSPLTDAEVEGLKLFVDPSKTQCLQCHNGPLLTNEGFHNIGTGPSSDGQFDYGRGIGQPAALFNPFNCRSAYGNGASCAHLKFEAAPTSVSQNHGLMNGAFKVPSLRNVSATAPYMHDGRHDTLHQVVEWYRTPPDSTRVSHELQPLELSEEEVHSLVAFLVSLTED